MTAKTTAANDSGNSDDGDRNDDDNNEDDDNYSHKIMTQHGLLHEGFHIS